MLIRVAKMNRLRYGLQCWCACLADTLGFCIEALTTKRRTTSLVCQAREIWQIVVSDATCCGAFRFSPALTCIDMQIGEYLHTPQSSTIHQDTTAPITPTQTHRCSQRAINTPAPVHTRPTHQLYSEELSCVFRFFNLESFPLFILQTTEQQQRWLRSLCPHSLPTGTTLQPLNTRWSITEKTQMSTLRT